MANTQRQEVVRSFVAWRGRLERAAEPTLNDEVRQFLGFLATVGTPLVEGSTVHFIYYDPQARAVTLTGEFNDWGRTGVRLPMARVRQTGIFYRTLVLSEPARLEYKLIVDGRVILDPRCPKTVDSGIGEANSYFVIGNVSEPPELTWVPTIPHGRLEEFEFESRLLRNRRRVHIHLPPGYDEDSGRRFSTLYVHDGSEYLKRGLLPTVLDNLLFGRRIQPLIAVMVDPVVRGREYRASEEYAAFFGSELLIHVERRYRTLARRETRGVMGASLGGLISVYLGLSRPHLFSKVSGQSAAVHLEEAKIGALVTRFRSRSEFYFDVGKYEPRYIPAHQRIMGLLRATGCPCFFQELPSGHNWTSWRAHLTDLLTFLWAV